MTDQIKDNVYQDETGLLICGNCHTPRQIRISSRGTLITPSVMCKCQREEYEKNEAEMQQRSFLEKVARMKTAGLQDKALFDYCFSKDNGKNPKIQIAHSYVDQWEDMKKDSTGLLLWGNVGTGKSFFAGCIANALIEQGISVMMTNFARILNALSVMYSEDRNQYIEDLNRYSLLIIDDLGIERNTEYALEQVFNVIDCRYRSRKPMIICTNLTLSEMHNPQDLEHARIYDRILERCVPIKIDDYQFRKVNAKENMNKAKELFSATSAIT